MYREKHKTKTITAMKKDIVRDSAITRLTENVDWRTCVRITRERLEAHKTRKSGARTYWERGVTDFALDLLENYENICKECENDGNPVPACNKKTLLKGADDWRAYCYYGFALIYGGDIAKALCTPSEFKRRGEGRRAPNARENWMDVQARAYYQAYQLLMSYIYQDITNVK